jgi:hypothetical protein
LAEQKKLLVKVSLIIVNACSLEHRRAAAATQFGLPLPIFWGTLRPVCGESDKRSGFFGFTA